MKALEWFDAPNICTREKAAALGGHYSVVEFDAGTDEAHFAVNIDLGGLAFVFILEPDPLGGRRPKRYPTIEAARAAAQADYAARILAALEDTGEPALRARAEKAEQDRVAEWNRRRDADASRDVARAVCETMRAERDDALTRLAAAEGRVAALTGALEACVASLERANTAEGVCCCGDSMDRHPNPMNCGHSPVDIGDYYAGRALEAANAALATVTPPADTGEGLT